uniref:Uncharacterized protein n=1 Tax=Amphimedon queenslandica TaxID=400682 RepID=A0A1X7TG18_AMPQE
MGCCIRKERVWGEVKLFIYEPCLCTSTLNSSEREERSKKPQSQSKKEPRKTKGKNRACFKCNIKITCGRTEQECFFEHVCWHRVAAYDIAVEGFQAPKTAK